MKTVFIIFLSIPLLSNSQNLNPRQEFQTNEFRDLENNSYGRGMNPVQQQQMPVQQKVQNNDDLVLDNNNGDNIPDVTSGNNTGNPVNYTIDNAGENMVNVEVQTNKQEQVVNINVEVNFEAPKITSDFQVARPVKQNEIAAHTENRMGELEFDSGFELKRGSGFHHRPKGYHGYRQDYRWLHTKKVKKQKSRSVTDCYTFS